MKQEVSFWHWHWHWQNLSPKKRWAQHGRAWLHIFHNAFGLEWSFFGRSCGISVNCSSLDDDDILFAVHIPFLISIYFTIDRAKWVRKLPGVKWKDGDFYSGDRELSLRIFDKALWWRLWRNPGISDSHDPRDGCFHFDDFLFGRARYLESSRRERNLLISLPEGDYKVQVALYSAIWLRPRWPFPLEVQRANIEIPDGIPVPGGDRDYAPDEDATYGLTCLAKTYEEAIEQLRLSVMRDRKDEPDWMPKAGWPAHCERRLA